MAEVELDAVTKVFGGTTVLDGLNLTARDGEFLVLLGPSGCGKTTALRTVAGLEDPTSGVIRIDGQVVNDLAPQKRDVSMVFQSYALYPHMTVARNIAFPLEHRGVDKASRGPKVAEAAAMLGLSDLLERKPRELSGGQRQRVALARAIVRQPKVFLMDEPLSNLDATLRTQTRGEIVQLQHRLKTTTIYVTHDQVEAMTMGHRIAVLHGGHLQQVGTPNDLYHHPVNAFVASFVGNPGMNLLNGEVASGRLRIGGVDLGPAVVGDQPVIVGFRPEDAVLSGEDAGAISGTCVAFEALGADVQVTVALANGDRMVVRQSGDLARPGIGEPLSVKVTTASPHIFDAETTERIPA